MHCIGSSGNGKLNFVNGRVVACVKKISPCKSCGPCEENNNMQALSTVEENGGNDT